MNAFGGFTVERNDRRERIDLPFLILVVVMCGLGFVALYTGSMAYAARAFNDPLYFVRRQAINLGIGLVALIVCAFIRFEFVRSQLPKLVLLTLIVSLLPFVPGIGVTKNGASRWIALGSATFQPSELIKLTIILFLANIFDKKHDRLDEPEVSIYPAAFMTCVMIVVIALQDDFSTALLVIMISLMLFFVAGVGILWFIKFCALTVPFVLLMILTVEYRLKRVLSFLFPELDPFDSSYQVNAALAALSEGEFWGRGLGNGIRKVSSIPEVQSDFIFAVWGEEMGYFGVLVYFALLVILSVRGYLIALRCRDRFRSYVAFGCVSAIVLQSIMNVGVVARVFPATGIPLPFFSSGGSSILITLCLCGFVVNVSRWGETGEIENV